MLSTPKPELNITEHLVKKLLEAQIHELANLPLEYLDSGWDNIMYRLGDDYLVRLPRRQLGADLIRNEQVYLDHLPQNLQIEIPRSIFIGKPQVDYPWYWSILPYFPGDAADKNMIEANDITRFIGFLKAIHIHSNGKAPENQYRGVELKVRDKDVQERLLIIKSNLGNKYEIVQKLWAEALDAVPHEDDLWIHGDLHPRNVLVNQGHISAVIDWGDITSGDVATDLASIWMLFDNSTTRSLGIELYGMNKGLIARTKGWVIYFATVFYQSGLVDNSRHADIGFKTFERLLEDFA